MEAPAQDIIRDLDPFGFLPDYASAIRPLGGDQRNPDPRYAFHTPYIEFRPGRVLFTINFEELKASFGELRVNINAFIPGSGRDAIFVTSARVHLADATAIARGLSIPIMTVAGATYAAFGYCTEVTDAQAKGITVRAEQLEANDEAGQQPLLPTPFGDTNVEKPSRLVGDGPISFADPVSQPMTGEQLQAEAFTRWTSRLSPRPAAPDEQWRLAFIAQALDRYGVLRSGARGIGWGEESHALAPIFAAAGCEANLATLPAEPGTAVVNWNAIACSPLGAAPAADGAVPGVVLSLSSEPADRRGFDFLWSIGAVEHGYEDGSAINLLQDLMSVLRPGGYAVHVFDLSPTPGKGVPRVEVERLAVMLISRGFSVAQLLFDPLSAQDSRPFGLIAVKD